MKKNKLTKEHIKKLSGKNHHSWTGDNVSYVGVHSWIRRYYGTPKYCEDCGTTDKNKYYEWANISGLYKRDIKDYKRLCIPCHRKFDSKFGEGNPNTKLTEKDVIRIRQLYVPFKYSTNRLAKEFNVNHSTIFSIIHRKTWKHI